MPHKTKKIIFWIILFFTIFSAFPALAASDEICFKPQIKIPGMDLVFAKCTTGEGYQITGLSISQFIIVAYKYAIGIVGIVSAIVLMWAGFLWLTAGGNQTRVTDAQGWIKGSLTGLALALCSFLILSTVNPSLTKFKTVNIMEVKKTEITKDDCADMNDQDPCLKGNDPKRPGICVDETCYENKGCCGYILESGDRNFCKDINEPAGENICRLKNTSLSEMPIRGDSQWYGGNYTCQQTGGNKLTGVLKNCILKK